MSLVKTNDSLNKYFLLDISDMAVFKALFLALIFIVRIRLSPGKSLVTKFTSLSNP